MLPPLARGIHATLSANAKKILGADINLNERVVSTYVSFCH